MKLFVFFFVFANLVCCHNLFAHDKSRIELEREMPEGEEDQDSTFFLSIGYQSNKSSIEHFETSNATGYTALEQKTDISVSSIGLMLSKEFFSTLYVSLTLSGRYGINRGGDEAADTTEVIFEEDSAGKHYGAGLSVNLNMEGYGYKIQPYLSTQYITYDTQYELAYSPVNDQDNPTNIVYALENREFQHSLGIRFFNQRASMMSYFAVDYHQYLDEELIISGSRNGAIIDLDNTSKVERKPIGFSLGFGFLF